MRRPSAGLLVAVLAGVRADLPVHCLHSQIAGEWTFHLGPTAAGNMIPNCSVPFDPVMRVRVELSRANEARVIEAASGAPVSLGQVGTWTTIYDEGFEVRVGGQHFFAFSKYNRDRARRHYDRARRRLAHQLLRDRAATSLMQLLPSGDDIDTALQLSQCDETFPGEYHSASVDDWGCYRGQRDTTSPAACKGANCGSWMQASHSHASSTLLSISGPESPVGPEYAPGGAPPQVLAPAPETHGDVVVGDTLTFRFVAAPPVVLSNLSVGAERHREEPPQAGELRARATHHRMARDATEHLTDEWLAASINKEQGLWRASATQLHPLQRSTLTLQLFAAVARQHAGPRHDHAHMPRAHVAGAEAAGAPAPEVHGGRPPSRRALNLEDTRAAAAAGGAPPKARLLYPADELPPSIDWRTHMGGGWLSPVRNQLGGGASCGSCYAFSTLAMVEARIRIATNGQQNDTLSVLDVVSCSPYSQGCDGGFPYLVGKYGMDYGYVKDACLPYNMSLWEQVGGGKATVDHYLDRDLPCERVYAARGGAPSCRAMRRRARNVRYVGGFYGNATEAEMLEELATKGPLTVGLYADRNFTVYSSGIYRSVERDFWRRSVGRIAPPYDPTTCHSGCTPPAKTEWEQVNHAVLLVGYGSDTVGGETVKYWIAQNSWGERWGEGGYFRIERGTGEASIESLAVSVEPMV